MHNVTIYTTPTCGFCKMAKSLFKEHNIAYTEKDVAEDEQARNEMLSVSNQLGVPVIDIDGTIVEGFDQPRLRKLLEIQ